MDQDTIIQWLMSGGSLEDIFGPATSGIPYLDEDTQDYINDRGTWQKKANDLMSDQATFAQIGLGAGGVRPEDFQPNVTYEPVKAPGYLRLMQMGGSDDPVSKIIAEVLLNKGTSLQAVNAVQASAMDPEDPFYEELRAMPTLWVNDDRNGTQFNMSAVDKLASDVEQLAINDPVFSAFDPRTGMPADAVDEEGNRLIHDPETNSFVREISTPTPTMEYFDEMNLSNPFDTYDPDIFAGEGDLAREAKARTDEQEAMTRYMLADAARGVDTSEYAGSAFNAADRADPGVYAGVKAQTAANDFANEDIMAEYKKLQGEVDGGLFDQLGGGLMDRIRESAARAEAPGIADLIPGSSALRSGPAPQGVRAKNSIFNPRDREGLKTRQSEAMRRYGGPDDQMRIARARAGQSLPAQALRAKQASSNAQIQSQWADLEEFKRKQFAQKVAEAGYNRLGEEMRGRQAQIYGG